MPIFRFKCQHCHAEFELLLRNSTTPGVCPKCGGTELTRELNHVAVKVAGPRSCAHRHDCPEAGGCGCGCGCHGHHLH